MRKTSIIVAAAIAALGSTIGMAHEAPIHFVRDGVAYEYVVETHGNRQILTGHHLPSGDPFRLVVANGRVRGTAGGAPVAFDVADVKPSATLIASR